MGMFDNITIKYNVKVAKTTQKKLDGINLTDIAFQTKDLSNLLDQYEISTHGKLIKIVPTKTETVKTKLRGLARTTIDTIKVTKSKRVTVDYTGLMYMNTFITRDDKPTDLSIDIVARFKKGTVTSIKVSRCEALTNDKRKKYAAAFKKESERLAKRRGSLIYKIYKYVYRTPVLFVFDNVVDKSARYLTSRLHMLRSKICFYG